MLRLVSLCVLSAALAVGPSAAQADDSGMPSSGWEYTGGTYGWFPWVQGVTKASGESFATYATPIDLIENFDAPPIMAAFEARKGKFSFWGDALYAKFAFGGDFATATSPTPFLDFTATGKNSTDYSLGIYQFGGFYELAEFAGNDGRNTTVEVGAGARFIQQEFRIKAKIDATAQVQLRRLTNVIERRIQRIENQEQWLQSLAELNALRQVILDERIIRAGDKGRERRVQRLTNRLIRVENRGQALAALEAVEALRLELLRAALALNGDEFNNQFAFVNSGNMDWVDPTIALRLQHHFGNGQSVSLYGDFGGYNVEDGLSSQMQLTYLMDGQLWGFDTTTKLGYRAMWLNYEDQTAKVARGMNTWLHGPIAEFAVRW